MKSAVLSIFAKSAHPFSPRSKEADQTTVMKDTLSSGIYLLGHKLCKRNYKSRDKAENYIRLTILILREITSTYNGIHSFLQK